MIGAEIPVHDQMVYNVCLRKSKGESDASIRASAAKWWSCLGPQEIEAIMVDAATVLKQEARDEQRERNWE